jgi:hypothetical protein
MHRSFVRGAVVVIVGAVLLVATEHESGAAGVCTVNLLGMLTQKIEFTCDPYGCPRGRGGFVGCVRRVLADPTLGGPTNPCADVIKENYVKSTCCLRNQNAMPCFQTDARGVERCRIVHRPEACRTPAGGSSRTSFTSCGMPCF